MPPDCPVKVLGHNGEVTYCVSVSGQLMEITKWDFPVLARLFGRRLNYAYWAWPAKASPGKDENGDPLPAVVKRLERDKAVACLIAEGDRKGLFDPKDRVRGRGGWRDKSGRFIWHSGGSLWTVDRNTLVEEEPGESEGHLYTKAPEVQVPWGEPVTLATSPAHRLLKQLQTWSWGRPTIDPILFLGWFATAYMGGALAWRPIVFTTGGAGVGKSTLHGIIQRLFDTSLHATADTTAAGIYQRVKQDSLPVTVDELENKPGSTKATAVIELARLAASGARLYRGGADHEGVDFQARSSFLFSAINPPPLGVQDKSRMAILNLSRLDANKKAMSLDMFEHDGRMILRQVMDGFVDFDTKLLPEWKRALHDNGLDARAQDTYGTLLAAAQMLLGDEAMCEAGLDVTEMTRVGEMIADATADDRAEQTDNWQACIEHLLASTIDAWRSGERPTIGGVIEDLQQRDVGLVFSEAQSRLKAAGLGLKDRGKCCEGYALAIPGKGPALEKIYADTIWRGGVWFAALRQGPEHVVLRRPKNEHNMTLNRSTLYCQLIDLDAFTKHTAES
ncbi:hypothetical protein [Aureimonas sp. D3]|uniref:hypothetical protein n=1 Tax=Aureimonas sp. D3 TaxID=1638164 RepID=UPI0007823EEE|nr:hypothetical protein [Aureimonas sp. D3]